MRSQPSTAPSWLRSARSTFVPTIVDSVDNEIPSWSPVTRSESPSVEKVTPSYYPTLGPLVSASPVSLYPTVIFTETPVADGRNTTSPSRRIGDIFAWSVIRIPLLAVIVVIITCGILHKNAEGQNGFKDTNSKLKCFPRVQRSWLSRWRNNNMLPLSDQLDMSGNGLELTGIETFEI
jgi:hypothetical protein